MTAFERRGPSVFRRLENKAAWTQNSRHRYRWRRAVPELLGNPIAMLSSLVPAGLDLQAHLLAEGSADEAPDAMVLPASCLGDVARVAPSFRRKRSRTIAFLENSRGTVMARLVAACFLAFALGGVAHFFAPTVTLGARLALLWPSGRGGLLRRFVRARFRNGGGCGGGFGIRHGLHPFGAVDSRMTIHHSDRAEAQAQQPSRP